MSFDTLGLTPDLVGVVADEGYTEPTPVQRESIPLILAGRDLLAGAQTGTGKTAAFVLPILQLLHASRRASAAPGDPRDPRSRRLLPGPIRTLVLTPTRELALQVEESVRIYGARRPIRSVAIYGGVNFDRQARALKMGPEIVVATPGRLLDHVGQRTIDLSHVEILVLDEADRMLDMGFIRDIKRIIGLLPPKRQNLMFSATFSNDIRTLAGGFLTNPATVDVAPRNTAAELVEQAVIPVDRERKRELLSHLVRTGRIDQALVFTRTKHGANRLAEQLARDGIEAAAIHGNRSQSQRIRALGDFKAGRVAILVATDLAARGIDIDALPHVVNFELPMVAQDYVHRIGRTGRAGIGGQAVSLVCIDEAPLMRDIEKLLRHSVAIELVPGFEPDRAIRAEPIRLRSGGLAGRPASFGSGVSVPRNGPRGSSPRPGLPRQGSPRQGLPRPSAPRPSGPRPPARPGSQPGSRPFAGRPQALNRRPESRDGRAPMAGAPPESQRPVTAWIPRPTADPRSRSGPWPDPRPRVGLGNRPGTRPGDRPGNRAWRPNPGR
jgi:ATP-dependent RNA helicase RhlE